MAVIAFVSAKGSPGVSTAALALTLTWQRPVVLAECDPSSGTLLPGFLAGFDLPPDRGLLQLAMAAQRHDGIGEARFVDLEPPGGHRIALPGLTDPAQAAAISGAWNAVTDRLTALPGDILADCGRLAAAHAPWPLLQRADLILLTVRPASAYTLSAAIGTAAQLRRELGDAGVAATNIGLLLIGSGAGRHDISELTGLPVLATLPIDTKTASLLCGSRGPLALARLRRTTLLRHAATAAEQLQRTAHPLPVDQLQEIS
jgi:hypothetical protein